MDAVCFDLVFVFSPSFPGPMKTFFVWHSLFSRHRWHWRSQEKGGIVFISGEPSNNLSKGETEEGNLRPGSQMSLSITREERREKSLLKKREQIIFLGFKKGKHTNFPTFTKIGMLCKQACYFYFDVFLPLSPPPLRATEQQKTLQASTAWV